MDPISLIDSVGVTGAIAVQWLGLGAVTLWVNRIERRAHGEIEHGELRLLPAEGRAWRACSRGAGPFSGRSWCWPSAMPDAAYRRFAWGITFAFNLWGAKALQAVGVDMGQFEFWNWAYPAQALSDSVLVNIPSVMNFGLLLGAMLAAGMASRFNEASRQKPQGRPFLAAVVGGLLLGYGARLGFGCNIGALFSG